MTRTRENRLPRRAGSTAGTIMLILAGPVIWAVHFGAIYTGQSLLCAMDRGLLVPWTISAVTVAALALVLAGISLHDRLAQALKAGTWTEAQQTFNRHLAVALNGLSLFAIVAEAAGLFLLPPC